MAEGVAVGGQVAAGVYDDPAVPPPHDPAAAPKGWTWDRASSSWQPAKRRARGLGAPAGAAGVSRETSPAAAVVDPAAAADVSRETGQDPAPAWAAGAGDVSRETPGGADVARLPFDEVPDDVKDDITGLVGLVAMPILSLLTAVDPYCGAVAGDVLDPAMAAALPLICRSSKVVAYFADSGNDWLLWGKLAIALKPLGAAIVEHHILGRVRIVRDPKTGARLVEHGPKNTLQGDPLQPHVQPESYPYAA